MALTAALLCERKIFFWGGGGRGRRSGSETKSEREQRDARESGKTGESGERNVDRRQRASEEGEIIDNGFGLIRRITQNEVGG